jgi:hypothetical protein
MPARSVTAKMQLQQAAGEPAAAALGEFRRLRQFGQAEQRAIKRSCLGLAAGRHRELDVVDGQNRHAKHSATDSP